MRLPWSLPIREQAPRHRPGEHVLDLEMTVGGTADADHLKFIVAPQKSVQDIVRQMARPVETDEG